MAERARWRAAAVFVAALLGAALTARLGAWQLGRAHEKIALQASVDARGREPAIGLDGLARNASDAERQLWRNVRLQGRWLPERTVYLDNRQMDGRPGFLVVTPLRLAPGDAIAVQRGWLPRNSQDRAALPPLETAPGDVTIDGRIAPAPARLYELGPESGGAIRQNLALDTYARDVGLPLRPVTVQQTGGPSEGLVRHWAPPAVDVAKHHGYAFQWFALCALISGLYVWFQLLRPRLRRAAT